MARYLTTKEVLRIHWRVIKIFGGAHEVRDLNLLESALARPKAGFGEYEAYSELFMKVAVLTYSLIKNHPFIDGNKRTGLTSSQVFLKRNGYGLQGTQQELIDFTLAIAEGKLSEEQIADWLKQHSQPTERVSR
jgi:death-on-curing protein